MQLNSVKCFVRSAAVKHPAKVWHGSVVMSAVNRSINTLTGVVNTEPRFGGISDSAWDCVSVMNHTANT